MRFACPPFSEFSCPYVWWRVDEKTGLCYALSHTTSKPYMPGAGNEFRCIKHKIGARLLIIFHMIDGNIFRDIPPHTLWNLLEAMKTLLSKIYIKIRRVHSLWVLERLKKYNALEGLCIGLWIGTQTDEKLQDPVPFRHIIQINHNEQIV